MIDVRAIFNKNHTQSKMSHLTPLDLGLDLVI
jgi:hypothetical protein